MSHYEKERDAFRNLLTEQSNPELLVDSLKLTIAEELQKPPEEVDYQLIDECVQTMLEIEGLEDDVPAFTLPEPAAKTRAARRPGRFKRHMLAACLAVVVMAGCNMLVASAFDFNFFDEVAKLGNRFISFVMGMQEVEISEEDKELNQVLRRLCNDFNIDPMLPTWFPSKMDIKDHYGNVTSRRAMVSLFLKNENDEVTALHFKFYANENDSPPLNNVESEADKVLIHKTYKIYIVERDGFYTAVFRDKEYIYEITSPMEYDDFEKVLRSFV